MLYISQITGNSTTVYLGDLDRPYTDSSDREGSHGNSCGTLSRDRDRLNPFLGDCMEPGFNRNQFDVDLNLCTGCIVSYPDWFELSEYVCAVNEFKFMDL